MPRLRLVEPPDEAAGVPDVAALPLVAAEVGEVVFEEEDEPHAATAMGTTRARGMRRFKDLFPFFRSPVLRSHPSGTVVCFIVLPTIGRSGELASTAK